MNPKHIIVADDAEILKALRTCLSGRMGFSIITTKHGEDVFSLIEENDPLLAIVVCRGEEDGTDVCRRIKKDPLLKGTPIILVLPIQGGGDVDNHALSCYDAVLSRPLNPSILKGHVYRLLGIRERKFERYDVSWRLFMETDSGKRLPVEVLNISQGGAFIRSERLFPVDTHLTLKGTIPGCPHPVDVPAKVVWTNHPEWLKSALHPQGMGLEFDPPPSCLGLLIAELEKKGAKLSPLL